jgi:Protein of unknown function (DUF3631)
MSACANCGAVGVELAAAEGVEGLICATCLAARRGDVLGPPDGSAEVEPLSPEAEAGEDQGPPPDTGELLDSIASVLRRFVVLSEAQRDVQALWALHTHATDAADSTPYLDISSAEKQSGKSRDLEVLEQLVARPMAAVNCSDAAMFRALSGDAGPATLLYDEVDALFGRDAAKTKEEQRGLLNAGWRRGAVVWRCVGDGSNQVSTPFPVFGPKALAGIGELPETIADRCIPIRLRRRRPDEQVERGRYKTILAACEPLKRGAERWAREYTDKLRHAEPELPEELSDRAQDGAEPLLAIADLAGGEWSQRARRALVELHADRADEGESWGVRLLAAIREAFGEDDRLSTSELLARLKLDDEAPWGTWGKADAGLTPRGLAKLLGPYGVRSRPIRFAADGVAKGYKAAQFEDAWERYITPDTHSQRLHGYIGSVEPKTGDSYRLHNTDVTDREQGSNPHSRADVTDVTDEMHNGGAGEPAGTTSTDAEELRRIAVEAGVELLEEGDR